MSLLFNTKMKRLVCVLMVCSVQVVSGQVQRDYFHCFTDICNVNGQDQFCSERERKCRDCCEIVDSCFEQGLPSNCSRTCVEFELQKAKESTCERLQPIWNGRINDSIQDLFRPGDVISVTCDPGYRLSGRGIIECKDYGHWSHDMPNCEEITCPMLPQVSNGKHNGSRTASNKPGDIITVQCNAGYQRVGPESTTCSSNGSWQHQLSVCQEYPAIPPIKNGRGLRQMSENGTETDTVHVICDKGYEVVVSDTFNWTVTGSWNNKDGHFPYCSKQDGMDAPAIALICVVSIETFVLAFILYKKAKNHSKHLDNSKEDEVAKERLICNEGREEKEKDEEKETFKPEITVSLHKQKLQKEETIQTDNPRCQSRSVNENPSSSEYVEEFPNDNVRVTSRPGDDLPKTFIPTGNKFSRDQNLDPEEGDNQSSAPHEASGGNPNFGKQFDMHVNISINNHNSADNRNNQTINAGNVTDGLPTEPACSSSSGTTEKNDDAKMNDLKEEELKHPVEESKPNHPQKSTETNRKGTFTGNADTSNYEESEESQEESFPLLPPGNGLAVQQNVNNEQDIAPKLAMPNGDLNTDDLMNDQTAQKNKSPFKS